jgi:hypothetical protein
MWKLALTVLIAGLTANVANAQDYGGATAADPGKPAPKNLLNQDYLTSTGATVPRPGASADSSVPTIYDSGAIRQHRELDQHIEKDSAAIADGLVSEG